MAERLGDRNQDVLEPPVVPILERGENRFPKDLGSEKEVLGGLWGLLLEIADEIEASREVPVKTEDAA